MPFNMSLRDFSGRLPAPVTTRPRAPFSNKASTASCNNLFSLLIMISGAPSSWMCFRRLFRLMMRRYRSFKSLVAKRPLSRGTNGRRSGGITGMTSMTIHSVLLPEWRKESMIRNCFINLVLLGPACSVLIRSRSSSAVFWIVMSRSRSLTALAPMPALNAPLYSCLYFWYSSSLSNCFLRSGVVPGSVTT